MKSPSPTLITSSRDNYNRVTTISTDEIASTVLVTSPSPTLIPSNTDNYNRVTTISTDEIVTTVLAKSPSPTLIPYDMTTVIETVSTEDPTVAVTVVDTTSDQSKFVMIGVIAGLTLFIIVAAVAVIVALCWRWKAGRLKSSETDASNVRSITGHDSTGEEINVNDSFHANDLLAFERGVQAGDLQEEGHTNTSHEAHANVVQDVDARGAHTNIYIQDAHTNTLHTNICIQCTCTNTIQTNTCIHRTQCHCGSDHVSRTSIVSLDDYYNSSQVYL